MNQVTADDYKEVVNNSDGLDKVQSISDVTLEEEDKQDWLTKQIANFNVPLSMFHYKDYNFDFP